MKFNTKPGERQKDAVKTRTRRTTKFVLVERKKVQCKRNPDPHSKKKKSMPRN